MREGLKLRREDPERPFTVGLVLGVERERTPWRVMLFTEAIFGRSGASYSRLIDLVSPSQNSEEREGLCTREVGDWVIKSVAYV